MSPDDLQAVLLRLKADLEAVQDDPAAAMITFARLRSLAIQECRIGRTDEAILLVEETCRTAGALLVTMPIRSIEDVAAKAEFGARLCDSDDDRRTVLAQIAVFLDPTVSGRFPNAPVPET